MLVQNLRVNPAYSEIAMFKLYLGGFYLDTGCMETSAGNRFVARC